MSNDEIKEVGESLGNGMLGETKKCIYGDNDSAAVIKYLVPYCSAKDYISSFKSDIKECYELPPNEHIVPVIGGVIEGGCAYLCPQYAGSISLDDFIKGLHGVEDIETRIDIAINIAEGLEFLSSHNIVHGLLKPKDVILIKKDDGTYSPMIRDYGLGRLRKFKFLKGSRKSVEYTAPELIREIFSPQVYKTEVDIFSFGCLLWQLFEGADMEVFARFHLRSGDEVRGIEFRNIINQPYINKLVSCCCVPDPTKRPGLPKIILILKKIKSRPDFGVLVPQIQNPDPAGQPQQEQQQNAESAGPIKLNDNDSILKKINDTLRDESNNEDKMTKCLTLIEKLMDTLTFNNDTAKYLLSNVMLNTRYSDAKLNRRAANVIKTILEKNEELFTEGLYKAAFENVRTITTLSFQFPERIYLPKFVHYLAKKERLGNDFRKALKEQQALRIFSQNLSKFADARSPTQTRQIPLNWFEMPSGVSYTAVTCSPVEAATYYLMCLSQIISIDNKDPYLYNFPDICMRVIKSFGCLTQEEEVLRYYLIKTMKKMDIDKNAFVYLTSEFILKKFLDVKYQDSKLGPRIVATIYSIIREYGPKFCNESFINFFLNKVTEPSDYGFEANILDILNIEEIAKSNEFRNSVMYLGSSKDVFQVLLTKIFSAMEAKEEERFNSLTTFTTNAVCFLLGNKERTGKNVDILIAKIIFVYETCGESPEWERLVDLLMKIVEAKGSPSTGCVLGAVANVDFFNKLCMRRRLAIIKAIVDGVDQNEGQIDRATRGKITKTLFDPKLIGDIMCEARNEDSQCQKEAFDCLIAIFQLNGAIKVYNSIEDAIPTVFSALNIMSDSIPETVGAFAQGLHKQFTRSPIEVTKQFSEISMNISDTRRVTLWEFIFLCMYKIFMTQSSNESYDDTKFALLSIIVEIIKQFPEEKDKYHEMFADIMTRFKTRNAMDKMSEGDWNMKTKPLVLKITYDLPSFIIQ